MAGETPRIDNIDARNSQGLSMGNAGTIEQHFGDKIDTQGGDVVYGPKVVGYTAEQVNTIVAGTIAEITRERQPKPYDGRKPYPGLTAFQEADAPFFYGREELVQQLLTRVGSEGKRFLCVTGASGSGKSSLLRAGLIPHLRQGAVDGSAEWRYASFSPQGQPLTQLANALARLTGLSDAGERFLKIYSTDDDALSKVIAPALSSTRQRAVVFIDQFEELFTYKQDKAEDEAERRAFIGQLTHAAQLADGQLIVLIALRSDFVSPCLAYPDLSRLLRDGFEPVTAMMPNELTRAIVQPALEVGLGIEPALVAQVIADMSGEPGALPLMQFALRDLLEAKNPQRGDTCTLMLRDYMTRGGLHQALQRHADAAFEKLDVTQKPLVRGLFARLISPGRGTVDTRRTVQLAQLVPAGQAEAATQTLVQALADARLLTTSGEQGSNAGTVTIAHETLLEAWPWLVTLRKELRNEIEMQNEISDDAAKWEANQRNAGYLYRDAQLAGVMRSLDSGKLALDALSMEFVKAGRKRQSRATILRRVVVFSFLALLLPGIFIAANVWMFYQRQASAWQPLDFPETPITGLALAEQVLTSTSPRICVATNDVGVGCSQDGKSWVISQQGLPRSGYSLIASNRRLPGALLGNKWPANLRAITGISFDALHSDRVFVIVRTEGLYRSENGGVSWVEVTSLPTATLPMTSSVSDDSAKLFVSGQSVLVRFGADENRPLEDLVYGSLYASEDGGRSWYPFGGLGTSSSATTGMIHDFHAEILSGTQQLTIWMVSEKGLFSSPFGPIAKWQKQADPPTESKLLLLERDTVGSYFYMAAYNKNKNATQVYRWQPSSPTGLEAIGEPVAGTAREIALNSDPGSVAHVWLLTEVNEVLVLQPNWRWVSHGSRPGWIWSIVNASLAFFKDERGNSVPYLGHLDGLLAFSPK